MKYETERFIDMGLNNSLILFIKDGVPGMNESRVNKSHISYNVGLFTLI